MKFAAIGALLLALLAVSPACRDGSGGEDQPRASAPERSRADSLFDLARSIRLEELRSAYGRLDSARHVRLVEVEQLGSNGEVLAEAERHVRQSIVSDAPLLTSEVTGQTGSFRYGVFGRFLDAADLDAEPFPLDQVVPEEPAYLSPRNRDDFTYRHLPDQMLGSERVHVLEARARVDDGAQPVRYARILFDPQSRQALGLTVEHVNPALLFSERSRISLQIRPGDDGAWVPDRSQLDTRLHLPLAPARRFRITSVYRFPE